MSARIPVLALAWMVLPSLAWAAAPSAPNECDDVGGMGRPCSGVDDCRDQAYATACLQLQPGVRTCQVPCVAVSATGATAPDPQVCAQGETCRAGAGTFYCEPTRFRMDVNLMDQCISAYLRGTAPDLGSTNQCSLAANLERMLDQNHDHTFDLQDFALCIQSFLNQPSCDVTSQTCPADDPDLVFCNGDGDCGRGLYCDTGKHSCTRECGMVSSREPGSSELERQCFGRLKTCDFERGRCVAADMDNTSCELDRDCPHGAYCLLSLCVPECSRSLDCPDDDWYCADNRQCRVRPAVGTTDSAVFDPKNYSVLFGTQQVTLTPIANEQAVTVLVMDQATKRQVMDRPSVAFGYRLEVTNGLKDDPKCRKPLGNLSTADQEDCLVRDDETWVTLLSPYGTVRASGQPTIPLRLNPVAVARLTPGTYVATLRAIFDNGSSDQAQVRLIKSTLSGEYTGTLGLTMGGPNNVLNGNTPLLLSMRLKVKESTIRWNDLLEAENLASTQDLTDLTEGYLVHGYLHGNEVVTFAQPGAASPEGNEIPVKGIYSPRYRQMRLLGVVDISKDFCVAQRGDCTQYPDDLQVKNLFGRDLRRVFQLSGAFDDTTRRYAGTWRETIYGLAPASGGDITLDGAFVLSQKRPDDTALDLAAPLSSATTPVRFPTRAEILTQVDTDIKDLCAGFTRDADGGLTGPDLVSAFADSAAYQRYLGTAADGGVADADGGGVQFPILANTLKFKDLIQEGLDNLTSDSTRGTAVLTIYDFLAGRVVLCNEDTSAPGAPLSTPPAACVNENTLRCGLALYRKAILSGYVEFVDAMRPAAPDGGTDLAGAAGDNQLFCSGTLPTSGCNKSPVDYPGLRTLQEHNRFHQELAQATKFYADQKVSDAFFALYRNRLNPFTQGQALAYKADRLKASAALYDKDLELVAGNVAASVLFPWPMSGFTGMGSEWIRQIHVLMKDRENALTELVDLRRRLFLNAGAGDAMLAEHLAQQELLLEIYLMALQSKWQGAAFAYAGEGGETVDRLQTLLARLQTGRNSLGIIPDRVFFESSNPDQTNWRHYLALLEGEEGSGGLMGKARDQVDDAVTNIQASLADVDALENSVFAVNDALGGTMAELCGSEEPKSCEVLQAMMEKDVAALLAVEGGLTAAEKTRLEAVANGGTEALNAALADILRGRLKTQCSDSNAECSKVVTSFADAINAGPSCPLDASKSYIMVRGKRRACVGGEMGQLLLERQGLVQERAAVLRELANVLKRLRNFDEMYSVTRAATISKTVTLGVLNLIDFGLQFSENREQSVEELVLAALKPAECIFIAGVAVGTDCPGKIAAAVAEVSTKTTRTVFETLVETAKGSIDQAKEAVESITDTTASEAEAKREIKDILSETDPVIDSYRANYQALFNLEVNMEEVRFKAQDAMSGANDQLSLLLDHLVGRETGSVLVGNHLVGESAKTYRKALNTAYRATMAFAHRYNLSPARRTALTNRVLQAVTLEDLQAHLDDLVDAENSYCAREAIDCDSFNNLATVRISLQQLLYPDLHPIMGPDGATIVTSVGQQFNNALKTSRYLKRRLRGAWLVDQLEIPFNVSLLARTDTTPRQWVLSPTECNHIIDGDPAADPGLRGTVAVNFKVRNVPEGQGTVLYELSRGGKDLSRSCYPEAVTAEPGTLPRTDYPIGTTIVGYAPESQEGQTSSPREFFVRSAQLPGCVRKAEAGEALNPDGCWQFFARDRTLAANDYTLYVPLHIGDADTANGWLTGAGQPADRQPILEDIVVYIRYRTRPISDTQ